MTRRVYPVVSTALWCAARLIDRVLGGNGWRW